MNLSIRSLRCSARNRGSALFLVIVVVTCFTLFLVTQVAVNKVSIMARSHTIETQKMYAERQALEQVVKIVMRNNYELKGSTYAPPALNALTTSINNTLAQLNSSHITFTGVTGTAPVTKFWPETGLNPVSGTTTALYATNWVWGWNIRKILDAGGPVYFHPDSPVFTFDRVGTTAGRNRSYTVSTLTTEVPVTNWDLVIYGLPGSGDTPATTPINPPTTWFKTNWNDALIVTSPNPAADPTAFAENYAILNGETYMPEYLRHDIAISWNAYEYIWGPYMETLTEQALIPTPTGDTTVYYLFGSGTIPGAQTCQGVTYVNNACEVDLTITGIAKNRVTLIYDYSGGATINVNMTNTVTSFEDPFILLIYNAETARTIVNLKERSTRVGTLYTFGKIQLNYVNANALWCGAMFLGPETQASGTINIYGHLSAYGGEFPGGTYKLNPFGPTHQTYNLLNEWSPRTLIFEANAIEN